jgi:hypothetical protein
MTFVTDSNDSDSETQGLSRDTTAMRVLKVLESLNPYVFLSFFFFLVGEIDRLCRPLDQLGLCEDSLT